MTHTEYTKLILNIKDNNIFFNENCLKISLCFTFWGLCDIIYMSRMNLERNIFDWLVNLNSFSTNEIVASQSKIFF